MSTTLQADHDQYAIAIAVAHLAGYSGEVTDLPLANYPAELSVPAPAWRVIVHPAPAYVGCTTFVAVDRVDGSVLRVVRYGE